MLIDSKNHTERCRDVLYPTGGAALSKLLKVDFNPYASNQKDKNTYVDFTAEALAEPSDP